MPYQIFIARLPRDCRPYELEDIFRKFGPIRSSRVVPGKGYGFVEYDDKRDAEDAIHEMDGRTVLGGKIAVEFAKGKYARPEGSNPNGCFKCGKEGHFARDCEEGGGGGPGRRDFGRDRGRDRPYEGKGRYEERRDDYHNDGRESRDRPPRDSHYDRKDDLEEGRGRGREESDRDYRGRNDRSVSPPRRNDSDDHWGDSHNDSSSNRRNASPLKNNGDSEDAQKPDVESGN